MTTAEDPVLEGLLDLTMSTQGDENRVKKGRLPRRGVEEGGVDVANTSPNGILRTRARLPGGTRTTARSLSNATPASVAGLMRLRPNIRIIATTFRKGFFLILSDIILA